jgi:ketosteroid isomerase-like protein
LSKALKVCWFLLAWAGVSASSSAEQVDLEKAVRSLVDAEKAYAKMGFENGFRAASLAVFAEDAVIFSPGPVSGKKFWQTETEEPFVIWRPIFASIARSGELGYTTGLWELKKSREMEKPEAFGHFVTIWRKDEQGIWKVVVDVGVNHSEPSEKTDKVETFVPKSGGAHRASANQALKKAQQAFTEALRTDAGQAVIANGSDDLRVYRRGEFPAVGKTAAQSMLNRDHAKMTRTKAGDGRSRADDLAYEYGEYASEDAERGIYFSVWRLDANDAWQIVLDLQKKAPVK